MSLIAVPNKIPDAALDMLRAAHEVRAWVDDEGITRADSLDLVTGADAVLTLLTDRVDGEFLDAAGDGLKVVANAAVGFNNIDVDACRARGVIATNTPGVLTDATADAAFGLMLMATRRFGEGERVIRSRTPWQWGMFYMLGTSLQKKTLGIVGMGQIGAAMARRGKAFGMDIVYSGGHPPDDRLAGLDAQELEFSELLATADVVSLHCPYTPETHHLIGADEFALMKDGAYLVNTSRGAVIDEEALVSALSAGRIAGAGLDVYENEPRVHSGLLDLDNAVLLPHLGSATVETRRDMATLAARNVLAVLAGDDAVTPVG